MHTGQTQSQPPVDFPQLPSPQNDLGQWSIRVTVVFSPISLGSYVHTRRRRSCAAQAWDHTLIVLQLQPKNEQKNGHSHPGALTHVLTYAVPGKGHPWPERDRGPLEDSLWEIEEARSLPQADR